MTENIQLSVQAFQQIVAGANQQQIGFTRLCKPCVTSDRPAAVAVSTSQLEKAAVNLQRWRSNFRKRSKIPDLGEGSVERHSSETIATFQIEHRDHVEQIRSLLSVVGRPAGSRRARSSRRHSARPQSEGSGPRRGPAPVEGLAHVWRLCSPGYAKVCCFSTQTWPAWCSSARRQ